MYYDKFDICGAYYIFFMQYHEGQWSEKYQRLCKLQRYYKPSLRVQDGIAENENMQEILDQLIARDS